MHRHPGMAELEGVKEALAAAMAVEGAVRARAAAA
jgi:hypothetical protein